MIEQAEADLQRVFETSGRKASLLGWSLGGIARELAKRHPRVGAQRHHLGTPFAGLSACHARLRAFFELVSGHDSHDEEVLEGLKEAPPSAHHLDLLAQRQRGQLALQRQRARAAGKNIEVHASHLGLGAVPLARAPWPTALAQPPMNWRPR
ncbi:MAG: hypothetical protein U1E77_05660 [Inhella sp.]